MFRIFKKLNPIVVDAFTYLESAYLHHPPDLSRKFIPDWWKNLPKTSPSNLEELTYSNMKKCIGFIDFFKTGFMIPMWTDLGIELSNDNEQLTYRYLTADGITNVEFHSYDQMYNFINPRMFQQFKVVSPWKFKTKENINFNYTQPVWNWQDYNRNFTLLPGILNFKYVPEMSFQFIVNYPENNLKQLSVFPVGLPFCQLTPNSDRPIKIVTHLIDKSKYDYLGNMKIKFEKQFRYYKSSQDKNDAKCPFAGILK